MIDSIIFDLDGTLWDATGCAPYIWNAVFEKHKEVKLRITQENAADLMGTGKTMEEIGDALFPEFSIELRRRITDELSEAEVTYLELNGAVLYEGVQEVIPSISKQYNLYIVSNCQDGYVPAFLHAHGMKAYFRDIEMSGRTEKSKGENIKILMNRNGIRNAVYVGDTEGDEKSSRYAGIPFIWAKYGFGRPIHPDGIIECIRDLPACINELERKESITSKKDTCNTKGPRALEQLRKIDY